MSGRSLHII